MTAPPATPIEIRLARDADLGGIYETHSRSIREVCAASYRSAEIEAWAGRLYPGIHAQALRAHAFHVAVLGDTVTGFGQLDPRSGEIHGVYVHPGFLRRGIGTRLLAALERRAREAGVAALTLDASLNAVPFYRAAGFAAEGDATHALDGGVSIACVRMAKRL